MNVRRSRHEGVAVLHLEGDFDSFETETVAKEFEGFLEEGDTRIVFECSKLTFLNSTTIAFFIKAQKTVRGRGGEIVVARAKEFIRRTLETLGLAQILRICDTLEEAVEALCGGEGSSAGA